MLVCQWAMVESCICWSGSGQWFSLAGSTVTVGQRTQSGKCVSDNVSVSGMVPSSKAFTYLIDCVGHPLRNTAGVCTNKMFKILLPYCQYSPSNNLKNIRATRLPNQTTPEQNTRSKGRCWAGRTQKPVRARTYPQGQTYPEEAPEKICGDTKATRLRAFATGSPAKISVRSRFARTQ